MRDNGFDLERKIICEEEENERKLNMVQEQKLTKKRPGLKIDSSWREWIDRSNKIPQRRYVECAHDSHSATITHTHTHTHTVQGVCCKTNYCPDKYGYKGLVKLYLNSH